MSNRYNIIPGQVFNSLTVIKEVEPHVTPGGTKKRRALCLCICGKEQTFWYCEIKKGGTKSCGCKKGEYVTQNKTEHGLCKSEVYQSWTAMCTRCNNPNSVKYKNYGGRGIKICDEWLKFENFYADMGHPPETKGYRYTIERIDVDGDYAPENCKWVSAKEQAHNKTNNVKVVVNGIEKNLLDVYDDYVAKNPNSTLKYKTIVSRIKTYGWSVEKAFSTEVKKKA